MTKSYRRIAITSETYDLVFEKCVEEFLRHHPDFKTVKLTKDFIISVIAKYYLNMYFSESF